MKKIIEDIAKKYCRVETLDTRLSDGLDFHDVAVWNLKDALEAAYQAGYSNGWGEALDREYPDFSKMCSHCKYPCEACHPKDWKIYDESSCKDCGFRHPGGTCLDS
jgi:hypothetical protein